MPLFISLWNNARKVFLLLIETALHMEASLVSAKAKRRSILAEKVSGENIYKALIYFDKLYDPMDEAERREFLSQLIEAVEIYAERKPNGQWLKSIEFKLPIIPHDMEISLDNGSHVETVCLLVTQNAKAKQHVNVGIDAEEYYRIKNS